MCSRLMSSAAWLLTIVIGVTLVAGEEGSETTADQTASRTPVAKPELIVRSPRVVFIVEKNCQICDRELTKLRKAGGDFEAMRARGWKIGETPDNHLQIVDREAVPELVKSLGLAEFPTVACVENGEITRSFKDGCSTPLDAWTFGWLIKGENERPRAFVPEAIRVASTGNYPLRGNHWSMDGDFNPSREAMIAHLRGAVHGGQIAANYKIETWSHEELRSLHDDLHEREMGGLTAGNYGGASGYSASRAAPSQFSAAKKISGR